MSASLVQGYRCGAGTGCGPPQLRTGTLETSAAKPGAQVGRFDWVPPRSRSPATASLKPRVSLVAKPAPSRDLRRRASRGSPPENESLTPTASGEHLSVYQILDSVRRLFQPRRRGRTATPAGPDSKRWLQPLDSGLRQTAVTREAGDARRAAGGPLSLYGRIYTPLWPIMANP